MLATAYTSQLLTIIRSSHNHIVFTLYVHFCVVVFISVLTIPVSEWGLALKIHGM